MSTRGMAAVACAMCVMLAACRKPKNEESSIPGIATGAAARVEGATLVRKTLAETRQALAATYRLGPDRRLLDAVAFLDFRIGGASPGPVTARFADGLWVIEYRGAPVGKLPELPDFEDGERLLSEWAAQLLKDHPIVNVSPKMTADMGLLSEDAAIDALGKADGLLAKPESNGDAVHLASAALASLAFQLVDSMQTADEFFARAIGYAVLDRALGGTAVATRAILAGSLGYGAAARKIASALLPSDPVRLYLDENDEALGVLAAATTSPPAARYLWHQRLIARGRLSEAARFRARWLGSMQLRQPLVLGRLEHADFETTRSLSPFAPALVLLETTRRAHGPNSEQAEIAARSFYGREGRPELLSATIYEKLGIDPSKAVAAFDTELARLGESKGALGIGVMIRDYERACMYSALRELGLVYLHTLSSIEASKAFAIDLGADAGSTATQFKRWYDYQVASRSGNGVTGELLANIQKLDGFGGRPLIGIFDELSGRLDWGSPVSITAARKIIARLDTRPEHRIFVGRLAWNGLLDLKLAETMDVSATAAAPGAFPHVETWLASFTRDPKVLDAALALPHLPGEDRIELLKTRERVGRADALQTAADITRVVTEHFDEWMPQKAAIDYFTDKGDYESARRMSHEWVEKHPHAPGLDGVFARIALANSLRALDRNDEGYAAIQPAVASYQSGAMYQAATLLATKGKADEADRLMRARLERYPYPDSVGGVAEVLWREGNPHGAATLLATSRVALRAVEWRENIGRAFAEVFVRSKAPGAVEAFDELKKANTAAENLLQVVNAVADAKAAQLAFDLLSRIDESRAQPAVAIDGYRVRLSLDGEAAAKEWTRAKLRSVPIVPTAAMCLTQHQEEPLWLLPEPPAGDQLDLFWLFRASAAAWKRDSPHREEVRKHFEPSGTARYYVLGRVVVGLENETAGTALTGDIHQVCEVAYYLGAAAQYQGRIEDASDWFRAALETSLAGENEYRFAHAELTVWKSWNKSLARIAEEKGR